MSLARRSPLADVVAAASTALRRARIRAVLTGGACATIYSKSAYTSYDLDFVLQSAPTQTALDAALASIGYVRRHDRYVHPASPFWIEFPPGPLGLGEDTRVEPVHLRVGRHRVLALSPTDSCRDRLAAFYHWNDRQSLLAAVAITLRCDVKLPEVERWSRREGAARQYEDFLRALTLARRQARRHRARTPARRAHN